MPYQTYLVSYLGVSKDHQAIFVETNTEDRSGFIFHVVGDIRNGMAFGHRPTKNPDQSITFVSKSFIGTVSESDYDRVQDIVNKIPAPSKQFDGPKRIDPTKPLRRCREWAAEAIQALKDERVLQNESSDA